MKNHYRWAVHCFQVSHNKRKLEFTELLVKLALHIFSVFALNDAFS